MQKKEKKQKYDPTLEMQGKKRTMRETFDWVSTFAQALFGVVIVFTFLIRFVTVQGVSMEQTLFGGDRLIITDINYTPERGDIVVIHDPTEEQFSGPIIKRVIATEGETVTVDYVNRTLTVESEGVSYVMDEPYINEYGSMFPRNWPHVTANPAYAMAAFEADPDTDFLTVTFEVGEGKVFVCGDNRAQSLDSRYVGVIDERQILGKVLVRIFPHPSVMNHVDYEIKDGKLVAKK